MITEITVQTRMKIEFIDITQKIQDIIGKSGIPDGICYIYVPHTTAGITINEDADPDVVRDIIMQLDKIVPLRGDYHHSEDNSAAHIKASLVGFSQTVFIDNSRLVLGTWQGVYLCEFDGPRQRKVLLKMIRS